MTRVKSFFLKYAPEDKPIADRLYNDLTSNRVEVWYERNDIKPDQNRYPAVANALTFCTHMLLIWSNAMAASENDDYEWRNFVQLNKTILVLRFDDTPLLSELTDSFDIDFSYDYFYGLRTFLKYLKTEMRSTPAEKANVLGTIEFEKGNFAQAIEAYNTALEHEKRNTLALFKRGNAFFEVGELEKAIKEF